MFELSKQKSKLVDFNPRSELNGAELVPAGDLKIKVDLGNDCLAMFHPTLKNFLYHLDASPDAQDLAQQGERTEPNLRIGNLVPPLRLSDEIVGAEVTIHWGSSAKSDIIFPLANINNFKLEPKEGGTVEITFRAQVSRIEEKHAGKLATMIGGEVEISIVPPSADSSK